MGREENVKVFEDTKKLYNKNEKLKNAINSSISNNLFYAEGNSLDIEERDPFETKVIVNQYRSFEAAKYLLKNGCTKVCVHNFASATNPGGGVERGSSAQEEALCRISTLYPCLNEGKVFKDFYVKHRNGLGPLHNDDCIYTPGVVVFKTDTSNPILLEEKDWFNVDVITCAAPNLREKPRNSMNSFESNKAIKITDKELYDIHVKRLQRIFDIAYLNGNDSLVIGAFGCGAFQNNPYVVSRATKDVIEKNKGKFKVICLAIYCSPKDDSNYKAFKGLAK